MKRKKLEVDLDKSCSSNSDIHGKGDIEQELEEDNEEIAQITNVTEFNESEKKIINKIFYWTNLIESEVPQTEIKGLHSSLEYRIFKNLRNTGSILRRLGSGRIEKVDDKKFKMIMEMLKVDNTLSALDIQKKIIDKGVNLSVSTIRKALKMRKYSYKKQNIATIILTSIQMKARKLFSEKYLMEDISKYIHWWSCFQRRKNEKQKIDSRKRKICYICEKPKCKVNAWCGISKNRKISLYFFTKKYE